MSQKKNDKKDKDEASNGVKSGAETAEQQEKAPVNSADSGNQGEAGQQSVPEEKQEGGAVTVSEAEFQQISKKAAERDEFLAMSQRIKADYSNYQKRMQKERESWTECAKEPVLSDILNVLDNFDRAVKCVVPTDTVECLLNGVQLTQKQFHAILDKHGVKPMETAGQKFDPSKHEAIMLVDSDTDGMVVEEVRRGYTINNRVLRPAQVKVSRKAQNITKNE